MAENPRDRIYIVRESERENLWFLGDLIQPILTPEMTEGRFELHMTQSRPASEPPLHEHDAEDEVFLLIDGSVEFWAGDQHAVLGPGDCILMPKDVPHVFRSSPETGAKWLVITAPGWFLGFLRAVAEPAEYAAPNRDWNMDDETQKKLYQAAEDFGITILAPPGTRPSDLAWSPHSRKAQHP